MERLVRRESAPARGRPPGWPAPGRPRAEDASESSVFACRRRALLLATILALASDRYTQIMASRGKRQTDRDERKRPRTGGNAGRLLTASVCVIVGALLCAASLQSILDSSSSAECLMSPGLWNRTVESLGSRMAPVPDSQGNPVKDSQGNIELEAQVDFG